jgi:ferredoxin-NADP reductase
MNKLSMYKIMLWGLRGLFAVSWLLSITGQLPYGPYRPLISISILIGACFGTSYIFSKLYKVTPNSESSNITALILYFIFQPPKTVLEGVAIGLAGVIAIASKYLLTIHQRHILNPAAVGAVVVGSLGLVQSRWWVGSAVLFPFVLILGVLIVRKIHRFPMVAAFIVAGFVTAVGIGLRDGTQITTLIRDTTLSFPLLFLGTVMLTEPFTTPPRKSLQVMYGIIVGVLLSTRVSIGDVSMTPEIALLLGNVFGYVTSPRRRLPLRLVSIKEIGSTIFEYRFKPIVPFKFKAGQYIELTLPLKHGDLRGNRRSFTIASSPTEEDIIFGIKEVLPLHSFKARMSKLRKGDIVTATSLAGDFTLPKNPSLPLVFIAGGIGVTPYRSMIKYLIDSKQQRDITLFYAVSDPAQIVYSEIFDEAQKYGLKVVKVLSVPKGQKTPKDWSGEVGFINMKCIEKYVSDLSGAIFYISGPSAMVQGTRTLLRDNGIVRKHVKTDYFTGY